MNKTKVKHLVEGQTIIDASNREVRITEIHESKSYGGGFVINGKVVATSDNWRTRYINPDEEVKTP